MGVERRLHVRGKDGAPGRHRVRHRDKAAAWRNEAILMRMQAEGDAPEHVLRAGIDTADGAIAVFDGERKAALLEWRAHALMLRDRHAAFADQPLGAAADTAPERGEEAVIWAEGGQGDFIQVAFTGRCIPKRKSLCPCVSRFCRL